MNLLDGYPFEIRPLAPEEGGGFLISYPDFADCLSDGETVDQAIQHGREALIETIETLKAHNRPVPAPNSGGVASGRFVTRVPRSIHAMLTTRARAEGVSLNALVLAFIAQGLGMPAAHAGCEGRSTEAEKAASDPSAIRALHG